MPISVIRVSIAVDRQLVLLFERTQNDALADTQLTAIRTAIQPLGSVFDLVERADATLKERLVRRVRCAKANLENKDNRQRTLIKLAGAFGVAILAAWPVPHKVTGRIAIEAADRQILVAPISGHVASAHARAGELVQKGQLLATLDARDLRLEIDKWVSEQAKNSQAYASALASHDRTELSRLRADSVRIDAELHLVQQNLVRSELRAPMDGVLLSGDLSQSLGAPVTTGDALFEVGSAAKHRMIIKIDERDVSFVKPEQTAQVRMASLPRVLWQAQIDAVQPVALAEKGGSLFRLPASFDGDVSVLRPGMEGVARIEVGRRSFIWVLTYRPLNRLRYWFWKLGLSR